MDAGVSVLECKELKVLHLSWQIKAVLVCKGSLQTSAGWGDPKRGKKPLFAGAAPGERMQRELGVQAQDRPAGLTFEKEGRGSKRRYEKQLAGVKNN